MRISVITPTADQPLGMRLAEQYMRRQTVQPDEWIVADDGLTHANLTQNQIHLKLPRVYDGGQSLANNVLEALAEVSGDVVVIWEHDDWYSPHHIATCLAGLSHHRATGSRHQLYYNVGHRCYITMLNRGSALCNTAFTADLIDTLKASALSAFDLGSIGVDRLFWEALDPGDYLLSDTRTVIGIKGLPGRKGLGMGHRPASGRRQWTKDHDHVQLKRWVGADYSNYIGLS